MDIQALQRLLKATGASQTAEHNERGLCTVPISALMEFLQHGRDLEKGHGPRAHFTLSVAITAQTTETCVKMDIVYDVLLLESVWMAVQLLPVQMAVQEHGVTASGEHAAGFFMGVHRGCHSLFAKDAGQYRVHIKAVCPFLKKNNSRQNGFKLSQLAVASANTFELTIAGQDDLQVVIEPCCSLKSTKDGHQTRVEARLPPAQDFEVHWTTTQASEAVVDESAKPLSVSVDQKFLISVSEGMVFFDNMYSYDIRNGSISKLEMDIDNRVRVLDTVGQHIQSWKVLSTDQGQRLLVLFNQQVEGLYQLHVSSELSLRSTSCQFLVPVFYHPNLPGLTRETGNIGVGAKSNVEVDLVDCKNMVPIDVEELPVDLRQAAEGSVLVSGYKYLNPQYLLELSVKKHEDQSVLVAAVDAAHFICTVTEEGKMMFKLIMRVRNTQKQYARVEVPDDSEIWSTVVGDQPVKPARCEKTNAIMIPLTKSSGAEGKQSSFQVELLWVRPAVAGRLAQRGTLLVEFPKVDLPLNTVFATVYAPQRYTYEPWQGDCRQVPSHSGNVPRESRGATQSNAVHARPQRRALASNMITQMVSQSVYRRDLTGNPKLDEAEVAKTARTRKTGVVPVQVDMVASGSAFLFQRLLVVNQSFHVQTTYHRTKVPWRSKRQIDGLLACCHKE